MSETTNAAWDALPEVTQEQFDVMFDIVKRAGRRIGPGGSLTVRHLSDGTIAGTFTNDETGKTVQVNVVPSDDE